jgi:hypothetical protein
MPPKYMFLVQNFSENWHGGHFFGKLMKAVQIVHYHRYV